MRVGDDMVMLIQQFALVIRWNFDLICLYNITVDPRLLLDVDHGIYYFHGFFATGFLAASPKKADLTLALEQMMVLYGSFIEVPSTAVLLDGFFRVNVKCSFLFQPKHGGNVIGLDYSLV